VFREQQEKLRALMEGCKSITVPLDGDAAAVSKFQTAYEALLKKARGGAAPPAARPRSACRVFNRPCQP
jgi:hypothetical protein